MDIKATLKWDEVAYIRCTGPDGQEVCVSIDPTKAALEVTVGPEKNGALDDKMCSVIYEWPEKPETN